jgi:hypothetical protein
MTWCYTRRVEKRLIVALSVSLGAALLVIAFLVGRMTGTSSGQTPQSPIVIEHETPREPTPLPVRPAEQPGLTVPDVHSSLPPGAALVREPQAPVYQPQVQFETRPGPHEPDTKSAIVLYFAKMDAIHVEGSGDPETFAQGILDGIERGDMAGIDSLVANAKSALAQATAMQPPPRCAEYHRRMIEALSEAAVEVAKIRDAIKTSDANALTAIAPQLQTTKQKIYALDQMKKQLLGQ